MSEFIKIGNKVVAKPKGADYDLINGKVYDLKWDDWNGAPIFTENGELNLPKKVYKSKEDIIFNKRVLNYFNVTSANTTGVLLAGTKGTGKSVEAKVLAKESGLPIIIVDNEYPSQKLIQFFKSFNTPVCIIFDEIEKNRNTEKMLDFLDGIEKTTKKLVLMTCNDLQKVSIYMQDRCSRVRYLRKYTPDCNFEFLPELVKDMEIKNPKDVIKYITNNMVLPSMDNLYSLLTEIKLLEDTDISLDEIVKVMNISTKENKDCVSNLENNDTEYQWIKLEDFKKGILTQTTPNKACDEEYDEECDEEPINTSFSN